MRALCLLSESLSRLPLPCAARWPALHAYDLTAHSVVVQGVSAERGTSRAPVAATGPAALSSARLLVLLREAGELEVPPPELEAMRLVLSQRRVRA